MIGRRLAGDSGITLAEVVITMGIMTVVGAVFTAAVAQAYRVSNTVDARTQAQTQIRLAVQRLDQQIRYAYDITTPSTPEEAAAASGTWYVEYLRVVDAATGAQQCNQLRLKNGTLLLRRWTPGAPAAGQPGAALASDIDMSAFATASSADAMVPFQVQDASSYPYAQAPARASFSPEFERLRVRMTAVVGGQRLPSDITFTALNTTRTTDTSSTWPKADVCRTEGRPWT